MLDVQLVVGGEHAGARPMHCADGWPADDSLARASITVG